VDFTLAGAGFFLAGGEAAGFGFGATIVEPEVCTKDHPAALPNYLKAGFVIYKEEIKDQR
jgi:hypothetical protein